jgi:hypothetical protein
VVSEGFATPTGRQFAVVPPPVEPDLLGLVERADEQPDSDGKELDLGQRYLDVTRNDESLVEDPVEDVNEAGAAMLRGWKVESHVASDYNSRHIGRQPAILEGLYG